MLSVVILSVAFLIIMLHAVMLTAVAPFFYHKGHLRMRFCVRKYFQSLIKSTMSCMFGTGSKTSFKIRESRAFCPSSEAHLVELSTINPKFRGSNPAKYKKRNKRVDLFLGCASFGPKLIGAMSFGQTSDCQITKNG
jgi:hypothetical protein